MWEVRDTPGVGDHSTHWYRCDSRNCYPQIPGIYYLSRGRYILDEERTAKQRLDSRQS